MYLCCTLPYVKFSVLVTYKEALRVLAKLNTELYAFTTDSEVSKTEKAAACETFYKNENVDEETLLNIPSLEDSGIKQIV